MSEQYFVSPSNYVTVSNMDGTIEEYTNRNKDKIKNMLLSNELKKKRCKVSRTFRDHYTKRDILRLKH